LEYLKEFLDNDLYHFGNLKVLLEIFTKIFEILLRFEKL